MIIAYFHDQHDVTMGLIAAENILDFFSDSLGKKMYNKAVKDVNQVLKQRCADLELELETLIID